MARASRGYFLDGGAKVLCGEGLEICDNCVASAVWYIFVFRSRSYRKNRAKKVWRVCRQKSRKWPFCLAVRKAFAYFAFLGVLSRV